MAGTGSNIRKSTSGHAEKTNSLAAGDGDGRGVTTCHSRTRQSQSRVCQCHARLQFLFTGGPSSAAVPCFRALFFYPSCRLLVATPALDNTRLIAGPIRFAWVSRSNSSLYKVGKTAFALSTRSY